MYYNFARFHQTLCVTPAMEAGIANRVRTLEENVGLLPRFSVGAGSIFVVKHCQLMKFENQVLVINTTDRAGAVIQSPEIAELEGRKYLCGTSVMLDDQGPKWTSGLRIWIATEQITTITEVPTVDEYVRRCALHRDQDEAKNQKRISRWQERLKTPKP